MAYIRADGRLWRAGAVPGARSRGRATSNTVHVVAAVGEVRMPCCVCGDPWTLESTDYVTVQLHEPAGGTTQHLGAHAACLRRVFTLHVEVGDTSNEFR